MSNLHTSLARIRKSGLKLAPAVLTAALLTACGGSVAPEQSVGTEAPITLTPRQDPAAGPGALAGNVEDADLRSAIDRYTLTRSRTPGEYNVAGVDLNGDGKAEAVVLFSGTDWCQKTGCSLVVFQKEAVGYKPVSHITSVAAPVLIGPEASFGWRDLMVNTGGGAAPVRTVRLGFTGKGYPSNALLQPEPVSEMLSRSQQVMGETPAFAARANQPPS
jgi:hypothetical protein